MDILTITGQGRRLNGEYECDIAGLVDVSNEEALTIREAHLIKTLSGARGGEVVEAFVAGDMAVRMAIALIILQRAGKRVDPELFWDQPAGWARFEFGPEKADEIEHPTTDVETMTTTSTSTNGGISSDSPAETPDVNPSPTGSLDSDTSPVSLSTTSAD